MMADRKGPWMTTASGRRFYLLDPRPEDIHPADIVHALARIGRFGGHTAPFYSVAQHCSVAFDLAVAAGADESTARWALIHDAAEAYIGDVIHPIKAMFPGLSEMEKPILEAIGRRFGLSRCSIVAWTRIKAIDRRLLFSEAYILLENSNIMEWNGYSHAELLPPGTIEAWEGGFGRAEFEYGRRLEAAFGEAI